MITISPPQDSRLAQLLAAHDAAQDAAKAAAAALKTITDGIKSESMKAFGELDVTAQLDAAVKVPEAREAILSTLAIQITSPDLRQPLLYAAAVRGTIDTTSLKKADPTTYVRWLKFTPVWSLKAVTE